MRNFRYIPFLLSIIILVTAIITIGDKNKTVNTSNIASSDVAQKNVKAIWVSYITLDMQNSYKSEQAFTNKIEEIVKITIESGFNTLVFQVRPFSDALYKSSYFPWSHILTGTQGQDPEYDPLEIICDICHKNDISVHAWINPYRIKTKATPSALSDNNPYIKNKEICFEHNGSVYLDPSSEKARELIVNGVTEIVKNYDVDAIQFDDYFYPENSDEVDNDKYQEYKKANKKLLSKEMWRCENVNLLLKDVYAAVHKQSKDVVFGISPQGNIKNNITLGADIQTWCEETGYIDYICPQIYFSLDNPALSFEDCLDQWQNLNIQENIALYIGLAGYKGGTDEDEGTWLDNDDILKNEIEICEQAGVDGFMVYSYDSFNNEVNSKEIKNVVKYLNGVTR